MKFPFFKSKPDIKPDKPKAKKNQVVDFVQRAFSSVFNQSLTDLFGSPSIQQDLRHLKAVRDQARTLSLNNVYIRRYLEIIKASVIGADGISVTCTAKFNDETLDPLSDAFTNYFKDFSEDITTRGGLTRAQVESLILESMARDGEALLLIHRSNDYKYGFKVQLLDSDHLDCDYNDYYYQNGNRVVGGVEIDSFGAPVAYHIFKTNPSDALVGASHERLRILAKDVIHLYDIERASQYRGYPWIANSITSLHQLDKYREATLVQARLSAAKSKYYYKDDVDNQNPFSDDPDAVGKEGFVGMEASPNLVEVLDKGWKIGTVNFSDSNQTSLDAYQKAILRGVASGLGVSYHHLANDLSDVNYSAARFGSLVDQEFFRGVQSIIINGFTKRLYKEFVAFQLLDNNLGLKVPLEKTVKFQSARYTPKSFASIDPSKDSQSDKIEYEMNLTSLSELAERRGKNLVDILKQRQQDDALLVEYGITESKAIQAVNKSA